MDALATTHPSPTPIRRPRVRSIIRSHASATDGQLVRALQDGDAGALDEVWRRHWTMVVGAAKRHVRSDALAQEVAQDVFTALWRQPERVDLSRGTLVAFLRVVARNRSVDMVRREQARSRREERGYEHTSVEASLDYPAEQAVRRDQIGRVRIAVASLPYREREVVELAWFAGHSYRQVAVALGIPEGTAKTRIRHGLGRLAETLAEDHQFSDAG